MRLTKVEFASNSNLQAIEKFAFSQSSIKSISLPSNVSKIYENVYYYCTELQIIEIPEDSKLESFPSLNYIGSQKLIVMISSSFKPFK
ncbi:hypothetical protein M9Y10_018512 [Tritrichomonas musculus]|uniref:Leucine-rich repeat domain-containing protein n=1 Tax=Tritrichomonas musculus TaxID=1915356 RepID=A0ABR2HMM6_9EUKA